MGRSLVPARGKVIAVRFSEAELKQILRAAKKQGRNRSEFIREAANSISRATLKPSAESPEEAV